MPRRPAVTTLTLIHYYIRGHIESQPVERLPGAHYNFAEAFSTLDSATSFPQGLRLLLDSYETWLQPAPTAGRRRAK